MTYPTVPAPRISYDLNGTAGVRYNPSGSSTLLTAADLSNINNESQDSIPQAGFGTYWSVVFPQKHDISGIFIAFYTSLYPYGSAWSVSYSTDTTNGIDGTWTVDTGYTDNVIDNWVNIFPKYRTAIHPVTWSNVKAVRVTMYQTGPVQWGMDLCALHLYGVPSAGEPRKLAFWHPTLDQEVSGSYFDFGDSPQGTSEAKPFRVKNLGAQTASAIDLSFSILTETSPTVASQHLLSVDGSTYSPVIRARNSGNTADLVLATGEISPIMYLRRSTNASAALGLYAGRVKATATFA